MATKKTATPKPDKKGHTILVLKVTFKAKTIIASNAGCLSGDDALALVESEIMGPHVNPDTKLKDVFPDANARQLFCSRVRTAADAAGCTRSFPCQANTTFGEIADALSC